MHDRIEKSGFRKGEYVLYAQAGKTCYVMRVRRGGKGWETYYHELNNRGCYTYMTAKTLNALGDMADASASLYA